jgi:hypothetical protein
MKNIKITNRLSTDDIFKSGSKPDSNNFEIDISAPSIKIKPAMNKGKASIMLPDLNGLGFTSLCNRNKELLEK